MLCAGECIGHAGVQMGKWSVHEVRVVQSASTVTFAGRSQQRRERVDGVDACPTAQISCSREVDPGREQRIVSGRRPEAVAAEF